MNYIIKCLCCIVVAITIAAALVMVSQAETIAL